ncbi:Hypothetical predicted protein [Olea europaea subsp. europaea]|uniref:WRC domain-containing protein n=1 Tax=Olea europaea subsp. europaea TaxID=158383 RepID=A0A8S0R615_OLEEU|nr:Hypothetical predicted protein [Olea europaea subsp. europaea]
MRNSKNGDPEPGRCKRMDGKKWRCSKDVAPTRNTVTATCTEPPPFNKACEIKNNAPFSTNPQATSAASNQFLASNETPRLYHPKTDLNLSTASCKT